MLYKVIDIDDGETVCFLHLPVQEAEKLTLLLNKAETGLKLERRHSCPVFETADAALTFLTN